jgi:hypothetical protein
MSSELQPARVLIVDDIEENLIALEALLRRLPGIELVQTRSRSCSSRTSRSRSSTSTCPRWTASSSPS